MFYWKMLLNPSFSYDTKIIDKICKNIGKEVKKEQKGTLNIVFVDENSIQNLNKNYRKKDVVTDVLSFHYFEDFSKLKKSDIAGEIILCEQKILSQGKEYGLGTEKEFYKLLIHSVFHILGYDHQDDTDYEAMQKKEDAVWRSIF